MGINTQIPNCASFKSDTAMLAQGQISNSAEVNYLLFFLPSHDVPVLLAAPGRWQQVRSTGPSAHPDALMPRQVKPKPGYCDCPVGQCYFGSHSSSPAEGN
jgi:hypothetical protein